MKYLFCFFIFCSALCGKDLKINAECTICFSPEDHLAKKLEQLIQDEPKSIRIAMYAFFHKPIANALIAAKKRGVDVEVVVDPFSVKARSPLQKLAKAGITIFVWNPPPSDKKKLPLLHDKFCIFGNRLVWTGSFNFTAEADERNRENAILLSSTLAADKYAEEFQSLKKTSVLFKNYSPTFASAKK